MPHGSNTKINGQIIRLKVFNVIKAMMESGDENPSSKKVHAALPQHSHSTIRRHLLALVNAKGLPHKLDPSEHRYTFAANPDRPGVDQIMADENYGRFRHRETKIAGSY